MRVDKLKSCHFILFLLLCALVNATIHDGKIFGRFPSIGPLKSTLISVFLCKSDHQVFARLCCIKDKKEKKDKKEIERKKKDRKKNIVFFKLILSPS